jgi:hypothetical protein
VIEFVSGNPTDEEIAAITAVILSPSTSLARLATLRTGEVEGQAPRISAWALAARNYDDERDVF